LSKSVQGLPAKDVEDEESTMRDAISALRCRLSAGSAQLSAARLEYEFKLSLAADVIFRLANQGTTSGMSAGKVSLCPLVNQSLNKKTISECENKNQRNSLRRPT
jgi:hypothetical protein